MTADRPAARAAKGFTLIELMVVIVILGMLVALVGPNVWDALTRGNQGAAEAQMSNIQGAINLYLIDNHTLPQTLDDLTRPSTKTNEPYMETLPKDPWGQPYELKSLGGSKNKFEIRCSGEDKQMDTEDDLVWPKKDSSK